MSPTHRHTCACGTVLICAQAPDACAVIEPFDCPTCLQNQRDEYFRQYAELSQRRAALKATASLPHRKHA